MHVAARIELDFQICMPPKVNVFVALFKVLPLAKIAVGYGALLPSNIKT